MEFFRRHFLQTIALAGTASAAAARPKHSKTVEWRVTGFTCITCAVGLETLLRREPGVLQAKASYPEGRVQIDFDPGKITEKRLRESIAEMGFKVGPSA